MADSVRTKGKLLWGRALEHINASVDNGALREVKQFIPSRSGLRQAAMPESFGIVLERRMEWEEPMANTSRPLYVVTVGFSVATAAPEDDADNVDKWAHDLMDLFIPIPRLPSAATPPVNHAEDFFIREIVPDAPSPIEENPTMVWSTVTFGWRMNVRR